jgi:hypothetical protein
LEKGVVALQRLAARGPQIGSYGRWVPVALEVLRHSGFGPILKIVFILALFLQESFSSQETLEAPE